MIVTLSRALVVVLLAEVAIVARRSPRHRPLVLWLALDLLHSLANHFLFRPLFAHTPQPFSGAMRLVLHIAHATFIAPLVAFTLAVFWLIRPAKIFPTLAAALGLLTLGMLVVGYGRGPAIGLYQVGGLAFTSERAFVGLAISLDVLLGFVVLPRLGSILQDVRGTDEEAGFVAGIVLELGGILTAIVLARYHVRAAASARITHASPGHSWSRLVRLLRCTTREWRVPACGRRLHPWRARDPDVRHRHRR